MSNKEASRRYRESHPVKRKEITKKYREANKEKIAAANRLYYLSNRDKIKAYFLKYNISEAKFRVHLKNRYGITPEEYFKMCQEQECVCKICGHPDKEGVRLSVDHCHTTKKVRGLLCRLCNRAIGLLKDDPHLVKRALDYLEQHAK